MTKKQRLKRQREREMQVRRTKRMLMAGAGALLLIIVLIVFLRGCGSDKTKQKEAKAAQETDNQIAAASVVEPVEVQSELSLPKAEPISVTLSFTGDCTLGTDENFDPDTSFNAYYESYGAEYFLKNVRHIFEEDDLTVVNMEGTFTHSEDRQDKTYAFKADPSYVKILTSSSVEAANLANNHSHDYGDESYQDTKDALSDAGIEYFGNGNLALMDVKGVKVGLSGVYELAELTGCEDDLKKDIAALKEKGAQIIAVEFHWGVEKEPVPDENQTYLAHAAIDAGADLVVGAHPHVLQGIEIYQDKPIVYSMGNFCFGGNKNPSDKDTMIYQQSFTVENGAVTDSRMKIIPCSLSSEEDYNDYKPTVLEGEEAERVLKKLQYRSDLIAEEYGYTAAHIVDLTNQED